MTGGSAGGAEQELIGRLLKGRYRVEAELGRGGMGVVVLATDEESFGRRVVVKVPHARFLHEDGFRERFEREVRSLLGLEHPHIVKVLDVGALDGMPFMVLQHLGGGSLAQRVADQGRLAPAEVKAWLRDVAEALDFIHKKGTLHRDVKPGNILFDAEEHVYLADFGIAKALSAQEPALTRTGEVAGSPEYMAPEAGSSPTLGPAYDQYALAVVVYEALSGQKPHEGASTPSGLLAQKMTQPPRALESAAPNVPAAAAAAVMKALAMDPRQRFESCKALAEAFEAGLQVQAASEARPEKREDLPAPELRKPRRRLSRGALVALVLALGVGAAYTTGVFDPEIELLPILPVATQTVLLPGGVPLELAFIPGGIFTMGCSPGDAECESNEHPAHPVQVDGFWIGRHEVTQMQWQAVLGQNPSLFAECGPDCPVDNVSWQETRQFLEKAGQGLRLPTEAEWEYAARGKSVAARYGEIDDIAWYDGTSRDRTHPVGQKRANPFGVSDLLGNIWEWCEDAYQPEAYVPRLGQVSVNPRVDGSQSDLRVLRGGNWQFLAHYVRVSDRGWDNPDSRSNLTGLRVALSGPGP